jgi:SAM-dependent methyltransferase
MTKTPQTWHYGLVAKWWAEFNHDGEEIPYYQRIIKRYGQPALDVACGTGRLLLPYLRAGLDVDGCDISADMLACCRERAAQEGLSPNLYQQAMHELSLPRTYKTIYICGSFGIGGGRQNDLEALRRLYALLEPGGVLAVDIDPGDPNIEAWRARVADKLGKLPEAWLPLRERKRASDGTEYGLRSRLFDLDLDERIVTAQIRVQQWQAEKIIAEETHTIQMCIYFHDELMGLLKAVGFSDITVQANYTEAPGTAEHDVQVFIARKGI